MAPSLELAVEDYEWLEPMIHGDVEPEGLDLTVTTLTDGGRRHRRMMEGGYDAAEFSLGRYVSGWPDWEFTAIPAFPRRFFPHSRMIVNADAGIEDPRDLEGMDVAISSYQNTHAVWSKGVLMDRHGLDLEAVTWYTTQAEPLPIDLPFELRRVDRAAAADLVDEGTLDAFIVSKTALLYPLRPNTRRLFPDERSVERTYYEETGFYPVMHNVVVRDEVLEAHPWVADELLRVFRESVAVAEERARYEAKYPLVWWQRYREEEAEIFGDIWGRSFELGPNREELSTLIRYAHEQGIVEEPMPPEAMFVETGEG